MTTGKYVRTEKHKQQAISNCLIYDKNTRFKKGLIPWNKGKTSKVKIVKSIPKCLNCNKEFIKTSANQHYCKECFNIVIICPVCDVKFVRRRTLVDFWKNKNKDKKLYCSHKCMGKDRETIPDLYCVECNTLINNIYGQKNRKFCSRKCYDIWQNTQETRTCSWCKETFITQHNSNQVYCSKRCGLARKGETFIEKIMKRELLSRNIEFEQYKKIGPFFVDFYLPVTNTVIECDGEHWHNLPVVIERDIRKNKYLKDSGYNLYRFTGKEIYNDIKKCVDNINSLHSN